MIFQIEMLIHEFSKQTNGRITDLINHEYIEKSFLFHRRFMDIYIDNKKL
jgi:hypothetical protein